MALAAINHFKNHAEFLNKAFKTNFKSFTKSRYSYGKDFWIWFVNLDLKKNNNWEIKITADSVIEKYTLDKRPPYYEIDRFEKAYRYIVLFEETENGNTYYNLGLYEYDFENSDEYNSIHKFTRSPQTKGLSDNVNRYYEKRSGICYARKPHALEDIPKKAAPCPAPLKKEPLNSDVIIEALKRMDKSFSETLLYYIDQKGITDVECYKKANIDRKIFSKIKCNRDYHPSKSTAISFAIALCLNVGETNHLLRTLGYSLSGSNKFDVIIECCIQKQLYDINMINMVLLDFDQPLLGY